MKSTDVNNAAPAASFVVQMTNGRGLTEYYSTLTVRAQARDKDSARQFSDRAEAEEAARMCERIPDSFSTGYFDVSHGRWTLQATVVPVSE